MECKSNEVMVDKLEESIIWFFIGSYFDIEDDVKDFRRQFILQGGWGWF
jgi:hypothetical protein